MALIKCIECESQISDSAKICPSCGVKTAKGKDDNKKIIAITGGIAAILILFIVIFTIGSSNPETKSPTYVYKQSMIEILNEYRISHLDREEAKEKIESVGDKVRDINAGEEYETDCLGLSITADAIGWELLKGNVTGAQIDEWIEKIESYD